MQVGSDAPNYEKAIAKRDEIVELKAQDERLHPLQAAACGRTQRKGCVRISLRCHQTVLTNPLTRSKLMQDASSTRCKETYH